MVPYAYQAVAWISYRRPFIYFTFVLPRTPFPQRNCHSRWSRRNITCDWIMNPRVRCRMQGHHCRQSKCRRQWDCPEDFSGMNRSRLKFERRRCSCCSFNSSLWLLLLPRSSGNPPSWLLHGLICNGIDPAESVTDICSLLMHGSNPLIPIKRFLVSPNMGRQLGYYILPIDSILIQVDSCSHTIKRKVIFSILSLFDSSVDIQERQIW